MLYESGNASSLQAVAEKFIDFLKTYDTTVPPWVLLNNELNTFKGATFKIYMNDITYTNYDDIVSPEGSTCCYLSIQHTDIVTGVTYANWLRNTPNNYQSEVYDHTLVNGNTTYSHIGKYGSEEIFSNSGEFLAFGMHTLYDSNLWMCEQGGITCETEAYNQINSMNLLKTRTLTSISGGGTYEDALVSLPVFPGIGCPMLTISNKDKSDYSVADRGINYYFTKSKYNATITIMIENQGVDNPLWQSMSFGVLDGVDAKSYKMPLYVAGGTTGLKQDVYSYVQYNAPTYTYMSGNIIDLSMHNICLSNSNICCPTKFNGANISNFKVLSPSGVWNNIYNGQQSTHIVVPPDQGDYPSKWDSILDDRTYLSDNTVNSLVYNSTNRIDTYCVSNKYDRNKASTPLNPISVTLSSGRANEEIGIQGIIPNIYSIWSRSLSGGVITLDSKQYLCVPCGWDNRLWKYDTHVGHYDESDNESVRDYYDKLYNPLYSKYINDKILIKLED